MWSPGIPALARDHRVIAPDLRGLGGTTRATTGYDAETLSRDAEGLLATLGLAQADVVGIDAGGPVAVMLGLRRPGMVRRLAVLECSVPGLEHWSALARSCTWWWPGEDVGVVVDRPSARHRTRVRDALHDEDPRGGHLPRRLDPLALLRGGRGFRRPGCWGDILMSR